MNALLHTKFILTGALVTIVTVAITANVYAATMSERYDSAQQLAPGTIVSLTGDSGVEAANQGNLTRLYGAVVGDNTELTVDKRKQSAEGVTVGSNGVINVLVSTQTGIIRTGEPIAVSQVAGIGQKAIHNGRIIGYSQQDIDPSKLTRRSVTTNQGEKDIEVGTIPVQLIIGDIMIGKPTSNSDRNKLEKIADTIAGKEVKPYSLITASIIVLVSLASAVLLIGTSGHASIIAVGRNPLSQSIIVKSLTKMVLIAAGIIGIGLLTSYVILRTL